MYKNLCHDGCVMVSALAPSNIAVSIRGWTRVVIERMKTSEGHSVVEIDVEEVKNDMVRGAVINLTTMISIIEERNDWFQAVFCEIGESDKDEEFRFLNACGLPLDMYTCLIPTPQVEICYFGKKRS